MSDEADLAERARKLFAGPIDFLKSAPGLQFLPDATAPEVAFAGWIRDLSAPDPLTPVNLFGFLPFTPPSFLAIGILPILVGVTMWLQFKLNPQPTDPVQAQVFSIMPWVLTVVMAPFAAGLQLYWAVSNTLTILQQRWLYSRYPGMKEAVEAK